ncbi:hypothetical protein BDV25DRAFT_161628 [Aspergillus avenaceus]|uniref:NmrA-like domain-containing protein n=1 Tax=Aspergillus avenaceus TaxID=36643 RepID=A0A5N6TKJ4_ASPAV|nr:hypothetical protein BDV25DRAFT_161628 [Aspergillus avenaceus]
MFKLVIFGATGQQGRSILNKVHQDPKLSTKYSIRAITRDATQSPSKELLNQGIEVVEADANDASTLPAALANAHTVILITTSIYDANLKAREYTQARNVGGAAVAAGAQHLIFSSAVNATEHGHPFDVFDSKAEAELYLRSLPVRTSFFYPGMFMQNMAGMMAPMLKSDGTYTITNVMAPETKIPLIDAAGDSGEYIAPLLQSDDMQSVYAASRLYSFAEIVGIISTVSGKTVKYVQVAEEVFASFMPPDQGGRVAAMMRFFEDVGYFGPRTEELLEQTLERVDGRLNTFEEFARVNLAQL